MIVEVSRRRFLGQITAGASTLLLAGCDRLSSNPWTQKVLATAEGLNRRVQRLVTGAALAREFSEAEISPDFKPNGTLDPDDDDYRTLAQANFADWRLEVGGLVDHPGRWSLAELRDLSSRTQITRHDCVEGWSCIAKWTGVPLKELLDRVGPQPHARFIMFHCADTMEQTLDGSDTRYYESIDLAGGYHPQTILAYAMNDQPLPVAHGAPLRLRDERQLGYKQAKYIMRIELLADFAAIRGGKGGYWEDRGYEWYAGI